MKQTVVQLQQLVLTALSTVLGEAVQTEVRFEIPSNTEFGDLSTNVAMQMYPVIPAQAGISGKDKELDPDFYRDDRKKKWDNPRQLAEAIVAELKETVDASVVRKVEVAGPGFINFYLSDTVYVSEIGSLLQKQGKTWEQPSQGKTAIVEFSSPNIAKPFTVGHLRSTIIGAAVANLLEATGYQVLRDNHLGDWGTQFGKQIYAIKTWGNEQEIEQSEQPVKKLVELYVKFHQEVEQHPEIEEEGRKWFKKLEDGDEEARRLWQKCIDWSWVEFNKIYQQLNVSFSKEFDNGRGLGESFFEDKMASVINILEEKKLLSEGEHGAKLIFFPDEKYPPLMIIKKDGTTLYATRDLATDYYRKKTYQPDLIVNEVGGEQALYFQQIFEVEKMLGWFIEGQRVHVKHGLYRFKDQKMSTRKGNVIWLEEVIQEAKVRSAEKFKAAHVIPAKAGIQGKENGTNLDLRQDDKVIQAVAIGALKWNDLRRKSEADVVFDWDDILNMDGNSGPYMQYTYARAKSVLRKAELPSVILSEAEGSEQGMENRKRYEEINAEELAVMRQLTQFGEVVEKAAREYAPHHLCTYLFDLAQAFNSFYAKHSILGKTSSVILPVPSKAGSEVEGFEKEMENRKHDDVVTFRLQLTQAVASVIGEGLRLLGIETVEEM